MPEFRDCRWAGDRLEPRSEGAIRRMLLTLSRHSGAAAEAAIALDGCDDLPPDLREALLALEHAGSVFSGALATLPDAPRADRPDLASILLDLHAGVTIAETRLVAELARLRARWIVDFLAAAPSEPPKPRQLWQYPF